MNPDRKTPSGHLFLFALLLTCFAAIFGCNEKPGGLSTKNDLPRDTIVAYLEKSSNYRDSAAYFAFFKHAYDSALKQKNYLLAGTYLASFGRNIKMLNKRDSMFVATMNDFVSKDWLPKENPVMPNLNIYLAYQYILKDTAVATAKIILQENHAYSSFPKAAYARTRNDALLAMMYSMETKYDSAIPLLERNEQYYEQLKDTQMLVETRFNIAMNYDALGLEAHATQKGMQARELTKAAHDTDFYIVLGYKMAQNAEKSGMNATVLKALANDSRAMINAFTKARPFNHFAADYTDATACIATKQFDSAAFYIARCRTFSNAPENKRAAPATDLLEANYFFAKGNAFPNAEAMRVLAVEKENTKLYWDAANLYRILVKDAESKGDKLAALEYKVAYNRVQDSLQSAKDRGKFFELEKKYETQKKEQQLVVQKKTLALQRLQLAGLLLLLLLLIASGFVAAYISKRKKAQREALQQLKFADELLQNTEDERKRIATDLHDGVSHELLTLKNNIQLGKPVAASDVDNVLNEVRQVSRNLYPAMFEDIGLAASIEALCERMTEAGLFTTCDINYTLKLNKRNELQLYRIIQEALTNTFKHAKADAAKVNIQTNGNELSVEIIDNGIGFNAEEKMKSSKSFGIKSLQQRVRAIGGKSSFVSDGKGTKLVLKTPIH